MQPFHSRPCGWPDSRRLPPRPRAAHTVPRTPDGHPDLQGYWTNDSYTPLERPAEFAGKSHFTPQEAAAFVRTRLDRLENQPANDIHYDDAIWQKENYEKEANLRTSLITDPSNGLLPPITEEAKRRQAAEAARRAGRGPADSVQDRSLGERCITWGNVGPPMLPPTYYANFQIMQTADYVIIRHELMHEARLIPLGGQPHASAGTRYLYGDARGRWEGDTLVVDTTNFTDKTPFRGPPSNTRQDIRSSAACTSSSASRMWMPARSATSSPLRIRGCGWRRGRAKRRSAASRVRSTSTGAMRAITGWPTSSAPHASPNARPARLIIVGAGFSRPGR